LCAAVLFAAAACLSVVQVYADFLSNHVFPKLTRPSFILNDNLPAHFTAVITVLCCCAMRAALTSCCVAAGYGEIRSVAAQTAAAAAE